MIECKEQRRVWMKILFSKAYSTVLHGSDSMGQTSLRLHPRMRFRWKGGERVIIVRGCFLN